jgi:hypothetical protein
LLAAQRSGEASINLKRIDKLTQTSSGTSPEAPLDVLSPVPDH